MTRLPVTRSDGFAYFTCACGALQAVNESMPWCASCFVEYDAGRSTVTLRPERKTARFAWAKAIGRAGGVRIG